MADPDARGFWLRRARLLALQLNLALWWERFAPGLVGVSVLAAIGLGGLRRAGQAQSALLALAALALTACALLALALGWRRRFGPAEALARLDLGLGLRNRLTSAAAGVGPWPAPVPSAGTGVTWRATRVAPALALPMLSLLLAALVPLGTPAPDIGAGTPEPPLAWSRIQETLDSVRQQRLSTDPATDAWQRKLDELRQQPAKDWYSHHSLEAGDALQQQLQGALQGTLRDLERAQSGLSGLEAGGLRSEAELAQARARLDGALQGLASGLLPLNQDLLRELKELASRDARRLPPGTLEQLRRRVGEGARFCKLTLRQCEPGDTDCVQVASGRRAGGGVDRGPGTMPVTLDAEATQLGTTGVLQVGNADLQHAALGESLGVTRGEHAVDRSAYRGAQASGGAAAQGAGGEAVWRSEWTPAEQQVLERYFR